MQYIKNISNLEAKLKYVACCPLKQESMVWDNMLKEKQLMLNLQ